MRLNEEGSQSSGLIITLTSKTIIHVSETVQLSSTDFESWTLSYISLQFSHSQVATPLFTPLNVEIGRLFRQVPGCGTQVQWPFTFLGTK